MWDLCNNNLSDNITKKHLNLKVHNYTATYLPPPLCWRRHKKLQTTRATELAARQAA